MQMQVIDRPDGLTQIKLIGSLDIGGTGEIDMKFQGAVTSAREHAIVDMTEVDLSRRGLGTSCAMIVAAFLPKCR